MNKKTKGKKKKHRKKYHGFWVFFRIQFVLLLLVVAGVAYYYLGGDAAAISQYKADAKDKVDHSDASIFSASQTSLVYDANGTLLATLCGEKDTYYLSYKEIPSNVLNAFISTEDKKFYSHKGVDFEAIVRSTLYMIKNGKPTQGGSTITQQLARNIYLTNEQTWARKFEEIFIALDLEKEYSKNQILEFYVNNIYFANGYYGIGAAAKGYFNLEVKDLSLSQIAYICSIPNNPTLYNPLTQEENVLKRRDRILKSMHEDGLITDQAYGEALVEPITLNQPQEVKHNYAETYIYDCAVRMLMEEEGFKFQEQWKSDEDEEVYQQAYSVLYDQCKKNLYTKGYRIYSSIDLTQQERLQQALDQQFEGNTAVGEDGAYSLQGAAVCIDNGTGLVTAIVGGREQNLEGYTLNRGYQSFRQPGSAIKPLVVYTPSLERGYTPDTMVLDEPVEDGPRQGSYSGEITLRKAVEDSKNVVAWNLFDELTPQVGIAYLEKMNFQEIVPADYRLTTALGGLTVGASPLEMAAAYCTIANEGYYREPNSVVKITTAMGEVLAQNSGIETQVYKKKACQMMTDVLEGVLTVGTAKGQGLESMSCAGKTGTTNEVKDSWFVGYTPYYTTSVWIGYDMPAKLEGDIGRHGASTIWHNYMSEIHNGLEDPGFSGN